MPLDDVNADAVRQLPIAAIRPNPDNPRRIGDVVDLAESIRMLGVLQAITVRAEPEGNGFVVVFGDRRLAAAAAAGLTTIPAILLVNPPEGADATVRQAAENLVRRGMTQVEQWRVMERLLGQGKDEKEVADSLGADVRHVRRLALLGRLHPPILDAIEAANQVPTLHELRKVANAEPAAQAQAWKRLKPKKDEAIAWWELARALDRRSFPQAAAKFSEDLAKKHKVTWHEDLFAPPDQSIHTTNVDGFLTAQREWLEQIALPQMRAHGYTCELLKPGQYNSSDTVVPRDAQRKLVNAPEMRAGCDVGGIAKAYTRGFWLNDNGEVLCAYYKPAPPKSKALPAARPAAAAARGPLTIRGVERVQEIKRHAVAGGIMESADATQLLGIALLILRDRLGWAGPSHAPLLDISPLLTREGVLDLGADSFQQRALATAQSLLTQLVSNDQGITRTAMEMVERIGAGLGDVPTWEATDEDLALISKGGLEDVARKLEMKPLGSGKATRAALLQQQGKDGRLTLTPAQLQPLAWDVRPPAPAAEVEVEEDAEPQKDEAELAEAHGINA